MVSVDCKKKDNSLKRLLNSTPTSHLSRLRWSEFPITYHWTDVVLDFTVTLVTRSLSLIVIPYGRLEKLQLIDALYRKGWNSVEIANHLNEQGILTPSGKTYYPKLVWVSRSKFNRRTTRQKDKVLRISRIEFCLLG